MTKFYDFGQAANAHVEVLEEDDRGFATSAEFFFDYTVDRPVMGRYGFYGVTRSLVAEFQAAGFTGFEVGDVECSVWPDAQYPDSVELPDIVLLIVTGEFMSDDFSLGRRKHLTISERVHRLLVMKDPYAIKSSTELRPDGQPVRFSL